MNNTNNISIKNKVKNTMKEKHSYSMMQIALTILFVTCLLISNIAVIKTISLPFGIIATGAELVFPITYILSDVFSEVYGYRWSRITCYFGFASNLLMTIVLNLVILIPYPEYFTDQDAITTVFSNTPRVFIASALAFIIGDFVNDNVFEVLKKKHKDDMKGFSIRAILSSFTGELVDSLIFVPIAFIGKMELKDLLYLIAFQVLVKVLYELILLPITTYVTKRIRTYEMDDVKID